MKNLAHLQGGFTSSPVSVHHYDGIKGIPFKDFTLLPAYRCSKKSYTWKSGPSKRVHVKMPLAQYEVPLLTDKRACPIDKAPLVKTWAVKVLRLPSVNRYSSEAPYDSLVVHKRNCRPAVKGKLTFFIYYAAGHKLVPSEIVHNGTCRGSAVPYPILPYLLI